MIKMKYGMEYGGNFVPPSHGTSSSESNNILNVCLDCRGCRGSIYGFLVLWLKLSRFALCFVSPFCCKCMCFAVMFD